MRPARRTVPYTSLEAARAGMECVRRIPRSFLWHMPPWGLYADRAWAVVSGVAFDRSAETLLRGTSGVVTLAFGPKTRRFQTGALCGVRTLRAVAFPEGLERLDVHVPQGETKKSVGVFEWSGLAHVRLPRTLRTIGARVFANCGDLRAIEFPEGLEEIGEYTFHECGLRSLKIPASVVRLGFAAFNHCRALAEVEFAENSKLSEIDCFCFAETALRELELPESVKSVEMCAFHSCRDLRVVYAHKGRVPCARLCFNPHVLVGPPRLERAGNALVWDLRALKRVALPDGVDRVGERWFAGSGVEAVCFPESVRIISPEAFRGCARLKTLKFSRDCKILQIWAGAFAESGLEAFVAPASLRMLAQGAFWKCARLKRAKLNAELMALGSTELETDQWANVGVFESSALERVDLPAELRDLKRHAFYGCKALQHVDLPKSLYFMGERVLGCTGLRNVEIPGSVHVIERDAFRGCAELVRVVLSEGLEKLGPHCFAGCTLRKVKLPASVREICEGAFDCCGSLVRVTIPAKSALQIVGRVAFARTRVARKQVLFLGTVTEEPDAFQ